ncbi:MAG: hypothetical protein WD734_03450 [Dehalococcoidia bacterium]
MLRRGPEGCVELYTQETFDAEVRRRLGSEEGNRRTRGRRVRRAFLPDAYGIEVDRQGRILIPPQLREAEANSGKVLVIGCGDYLELWHPDRWAEEQRRLEEEQAGEDDQE